MKKFSVNCDVEAFELNGTMFKVHETYYRPSANIGGAKRDIKNLTISGNLPVGTVIENFKALTKKSTAVVSLYTDYECRESLRNYRIKAGESLIYAKVSDYEENLCQIYTISIMGTGSTDTDKAYNKYKEPTVIVSDIYSMRVAIEEAQPGQVIGVTKGDYYIYAESKHNFRPTFHNKHNIILRSVSGNYDDVIFRGSGFHKEGGYFEARPHNEMIVISGGSSDITLYGLTIRDSNANGYKIEGTNERNITLDTCRAVDINEYSVKGSAGGGNDSFVYNLVIINCLFENTQKPYAAPDSDHLADFRGNYIGAIDIMNTRGSYIADNTFINLNGADEVHNDAFGAIGFWGQGGHEDAIVERNFIYNCDRGIMLGLTGELSSGRPAVNRGIVRNNIVYGAAWDSISCGITNEVQIYNNTIVRVDSNSHSNRGIRDAYKNSTNLIVKNNIACDLENIIDRGFIVENNITIDQITPSYFANVPNFKEIILGLTAEDFKLTSTAVNAIGKAQALPILVPEDYFGNPRGDNPDIGAHQSIFQHN